MGCRDRTHIAIARTAQCARRGRIAGRTTLFEQHSDTCSLRWTALYLPATQSCRPWQATENGACDKPARF